MAKYELKLPKMGESVIEATLTAWLVNVGDTIQIDDGVLEVSTDKVDTELPSEVAGILVEKLFDVDDVVKVGETIAIIETSDDLPSNTIKEVPNTTDEKASIVSAPSIEANLNEDIPSKAAEIKSTIFKAEDTDKFLSPLVKSIIQKENITLSELESIQGTGKDHRITKDDVLSFLENRNSSTKTVVSQDMTVKNTIKKQPKESSVNADGNVVIPMDRMGKLIAKHMVDSKQTSAHVQSFIEIDVTNIVKWRNKVKNQFLEQKGEKLTFTPIFMQAIAQTITEFPMVNISVEGTDIIKKKNINLGMAAALADGNLIVPVIKNADELSLMGMAKAVNNLATKARTGKLSPDDIQGGTYTVTNVGSFGSITGTPIINQPQVAILALGAIRKMPAVIETPDGDFIGIRHKMIVAHSYDHRVVNGALGGQFILRLKEILESFDVNQTI